MTDDNEEYKGLDCDKLDKMAKEAVLKSRQDLHRKGISTVQLDKETGRLCEEAPDGTITFIDKNKKEADDSKNEYYEIGSSVYKVYQRTENDDPIGSVYVPGKGFAPADGWEIVLNGQPISEEEFNKYVQKHSINNKTFSDRIRNKGKGE